MKEKIKTFLQGQHKGVILLFVFLWIKSYVVSRFVFDLSIENGIEELILVINSFVSVLLLLTFVTLFSKRQKVFRRFTIASFIVTFVLFSNIVYYRFFNDFITIPVLFQFKNFSDLGGSAAGLMSPWDPLLFVEFILLFFLVRKKEFNETLQINKHPRKTLILLSGVILFLNLSLAESQRPQLLTRIFDREMVVKYLGIYNYHLFDLFVHSKSKAQRAFAEGSDIIEIENFVGTIDQEENELTGIAKDKNVFLISMESMQNFLINYKVEGQEVTPFLNDLTESSYYFNNFYHQTGQGKTSDSEFIIDNSFYALSRGAVFTTNAQNEYYALPEILSENGYNPVVFHGNNASFWNRDIMYQTLGYHKFYSEEYYNITEENSINYGLKDIPFFEQTVPMLKQLEQPFHAKFITLTHHYPYLLDDEDIMIPATQTGDGSVDRYFQTARYFDESLKLFFEQLKAEGLYEDSIFIMYGDHYGISHNHNRAMAEIIGKEITPYEHVQLQKVPLLIHIPGEEGKTIDTVSSQIDLKPTILNLLGITVEHDIQFGEDLFSENREDLAILRDGSYVSDDYVFAKEICYDRLTGLEVQLESDKNTCLQIKERVDQELMLSDKLIQLDLLRFMDTKPTSEIEDSLK